jgi:hypothetical protein
MRIQSLISNVKYLALNFHSCPFNWVRRDANELAHTLAKFVVTQPVYPLCNSYNFSHFAREACLRNLMLLSS